MPPEKPKSGPPEKDRFAEAAVWIFALLILGSAVTGVMNYIHNDPLFRSGWSGLSQHSIILANTRPMDSLANPIGVNVIATEDSTAVLDDAGGSRIGTQSFGAKGTVAQGPVQVNGINYYYVDFQNPPNGWVAEKNIAYVEGQPTAFARFLLFVFAAVTYIKYILWLLSLLIVIFLVYIIRRLTAVRVNTRQKLFPTLAVTEPTVSINPKWERVLTHIESPNENDWRLAVIEADIMLSELLDTMQLAGDSIGEKLKGVEKSDFVTLDLAWEAHKVRNQIAHAGGDFRLSQREALRVVELYREVFKEFQFI